VPISGFLGVFFEVFGAIFGVLCEFYEKKLIVFRRFLHKTTIFPSKNTRKYPKKHHFYIKKHVFPIIKHDFPIKNHLHALKNERKRRVIPANTRNRGLK
jgi:hypothetical protein